MNLTVIINGCPASVFVAQKIANVEVFKQSGSTSGYFRFSEFQHTMSLLGKDCGQTVYNLGTPTPSWLSLDSTNRLIKYDVASVSKPGVYSFELQATLKRYPTVSTSERFNVTVASSEIICNQLAP